jgi:hypothetical protein
MIGTTKHIELLSNESLDQVVGGLNPQPLPPGPPPELFRSIGSLFGHIAFNQQRSALPIFFRF